MATILEYFVGSCAKKLQDIVTEEAILILGVKEGLIELQRKMEQIQFFLHDAEQRSIKESAVTNWLCQLRDAVYDADAIIDLAKSKARKLLPDQSSSFSCSGLSLSSCFSNIQTRHEIAISIETLNKRIDNISKDIAFISLMTTQPTVTVSVPKQTRSSSLVEPNLVGKEVIHACQNIVDLVLAQKENRCYKLAIVGTGGVGKTTLAQKIYNDQKLKGNFNIHAWVCVSNDFSEIGILKEILRKINVQYLQDEVIDELQSKLESSIQDKTFFLVLDDVWQSDIWTNLLRIPLCAAATGVVLLTTRSDTIAAEIGVDHTHRVDLLSMDVGWELLWKSMGIKEEKQVQNLQDLGIDIVRRCGGLPFAIKIIARVLASKDHNEKEWKKVLEKDTWSMTTEPTVTVSVPKQTRSSSLVEPNLVGKEVIHACKNIVDLVLAQKENRCYKLAIVGTGGIGKTTLAQKIYNDQKLKGSFNICAWVCVSNDFSEIVILKKILRKIGVQYLQDEEIHELHRKLQLSIRDKFFFLVLDDMWQSDIWTNLLRIPLCAAATGVVLLTTRSDTIAAEIGVDHTHRVDLLSMDVGWELLWKSMGIKEEKQVQNLQTLGIDIVRRCGGLPLAIKGIARVLASKDHNEKEWKKILEKDTWSMTKLPREITNALYLSYEELPCTALKICLLYLNVFPENYKIDKARLIWMWIAEGFIQSEGQVNSLFELGERYFNELINRSMIQPVYNNGMIEHCYVQNMVLILIHHLSSEENFVNIFSDEYGTSAVDRIPRIRRLSIQNGKEDHTIIQTTRSIMQQVRSVIVFPSAVDRMPSFGSLRDLCVLDLNDCDLSQGLSLKHLGSLLYLKYLGLSNTCIAQLPEEVGNLQFLQILSVKGNEIANLPSTIVDLMQLMCLQIDMDTRVPNGLIAHLIFLEELSQIGIYDSADIEALCRLTKLRVLGICCYTECMDTLEKSLVDCLCKLQKLQNLSIWVASGECKLDALILPPHLCRLSLHGCWLSTLPNWVSHSSHMNLSSISIAVIELQKEDLENLGRLPALCYLNLKVDHENLGVLRRFIIDAALFQCLLSCVLWGFRGPVIYTQGAMPRLTSLQFTLHVRDTREIAGSSDGGYNFGIENLLSLQDVTVLLRCGGASNQEVQQVKAALRDATKIHPNHPTIDFIGCEDKEEMIDWT